MDAGFVEKCETLRECMNYGMSWTTANLQTALYDTLRQAGTNTHFCIFVDGLDECEDDRYDLVQYLASLEESGSVKICTSSRAWNVFEGIYGARSASLCVRLQDVNHGDLTMYIDGRLAADPRFKAMVASDAQVVELLTELRTRAEGVFLWVHLAVQTLRRGLGQYDHMTSLRQRLYTLPNELEDLWQSVLGSIEPHYRLYTARTLLILCTVKRLTKDGHDAPLLWIPFIEEDLHSSHQRESSITQTAEHKSISTFNLLRDAKRTVTKWCSDLIEVKMTDQEERVTIERSLIAVLNEQDWADVAMDVFGFGHRSVWEFIMSKMADGTLDQLAGQSFDPALTICHTLMRIVQCMPGPDSYTWMGIMDNFCRYACACSHENHTAAIVHLLDLDTMAQAAHDANGGSSWVLGHCPEVVYWFETDVSESRFAMLMSLILNLGHSALFWSMIGRSDFSKGAWKAWLPSCLFTLYSRTTSPFDGDQDYEDSDRSPAEAGALAILDLDFDINEPMVLQHEDRRQSIWQLYLSKLHLTLQGHDSRFDGHDWDATLRILQVMLRKGADIEADIHVSRWSTPNIQIVAASQAFTSDHWEPSNSDLGRTGYADLFFHIGTLLE